MSIVTGQTASASDFVSTSAGAGDSGKVPKLGPAGRIDKSFFPTVGCRAIQIATTAFSTSAATIIFGGESFDTDTMHSTVSNTSRITFNTAGTYMVGASVSGNSGGGTIALKLLLNGTTVIGYGGGSYPSSGAFGGAALTAVRAFSVNDYIEVLATSNLTETTSGDESTNFWAILIPMP